MIPYQITFLDFPESDAVKAAVEKKIEKIERFSDRIIRCEVTVSCPHRHRHADRLYNVRVHLLIPGDDVVINRHPSEHEEHRDIYVAIRDAFNAATRVLEDQVRKIRHQTKHHSNEDLSQKAL